MRSKTWNGLLVIVLTVIVSGLFAAPHQAEAACVNQTPPPKLTMHKIPVLFECATISSQQDGPWSSAATWQEPRVPAPGDAGPIVAGHTVTFDKD